MSHHAEDVEKIVSTGALPGWHTVEHLVETAHATFADVRDGEVADYIPALAEADPELFGVCVVEVDGSVHSAGDVEHRFSVQSISKAFVFALACQEVGHKRVLESIGVNNTGLSFSSVMAIELNGGHPMNPMVNVGAIATTALAPGADQDARWDFVRDGLSRFAGRELEVDEGVLASETEGNQRNQSLALLLESYGRMPVDALEAVDTYTRQCSLLVDARDLAVMGATLAGGGVNPLTGVRVVDAQIARDTLSVMATAGMYEHSGEWLFEVGAPAKSGVSGGIVTIAPGKGGLGTYSPPLDSAGNSVRGRRVAAYLADALGLDLFASAPPATKPQTPVS